MSVMSALVCCRSSRARERIISGISRIADVTRMIARVTPGTLNVSGVIVRMNAGSALARVRNVRRINRVARLRWAGSARHAARHLRDHEAPG